MTNTMTGTGAHRTDRAPRPLDLLHVPRHGGQDPHWGALNVETWTSMAGRAHGEAEARREYRGRRADFAAALGRTGA
jgi:hypothetical protein